ncbi:NADPH-dependent FMN reductase [Agrococcus sp. ARC_14]|uniref:NADPH-dependent FMN reductase n=1 Tax=Agrococcus sp. ARC_14 TaxID=2919927 RepID=UPI001F05C37C|nr:NADPH-dependent FMN reductase [Agrococcus sp. ARC_14]MCH1884318.1 NAD(P)H-dependent oxidoreductase [Agrococcus sp. ARC_14]
MADTYQHEPPYTIGVICGSIAASSINRRLANALIKLAPADLECSFIEIDALELYDHDRDDDYPPEAIALKQAIRQSDGILIVTPEYNRSIPGALKNAIDWASRPYGENALSRKPVGVIGTSPGAIGTAVAQQHLKSILSFCNAPMMNETEAYIQFTDDLLADDDSVAKESSKEFLSTWMATYDDFVRRVLTVIPKPDGSTAA